MKKLLCKIGIHRPLKRQQSMFRDIVSGKIVFLSKCPCGKEWMTDSFYGFLGLKILYERKE
jgi:hypothetical protein